jgi:hypothetical protein
VDEGEVGDVAEVLDHDPEADRKLERGAVAPQPLLWIEPGKGGRIAKRLLQRGPDQAPLLAHREGRDPRPRRNLALVGQRGNASAGAVVAGPLPAVVGALDRSARDLAHRERGAAVGAAVGDHGRFAALGQKDGQRFAEEHSSLRALLEVLEPCDRLPTAAQRECDLLTAGRRGVLVVKHRVSRVLQDSGLSTAACRDRRAGRRGCAAARCASPGRGSCRC